MAIIGGIAQSQRAAIRLQLDGLWAVKQFSGILSHLANAYDSAVALHYLGTEEFLSSKELLAWVPPSDTKDSEYLNTVVFSMTNMALSTIRLRASLTAMPLQLHTVQLGPSGMFEAVGVFHPLQTVFGFVEDLRNRTAQRDQQHSSHERELLDRMPESIRVHYAAALLGDVECEAMAIARDPRVGELHVALTEH